MFLLSIFLLQLPTVAPVGPVYTAAEILTFIAALGVLITGVGAVVVNIIVAWRTSAIVKENTVMLKENVAVTKDTLAEAKVITGHVNSSAAAAAAKIDGLEKEIKLLQTSIMDMKTAAALLAQSAATTTAMPAPRSPTARKGDV